MYWLFNNIHTYTYTYIPTKRVYYSHCAILVLVVTFLQKVMNIMVSRVVKTCRRRMRCCSSQMASVLI